MLNEGKETATGKISAADEDPGITLWSTHRNSCPHNCDVGMYEPKAVLASAV